MNRQLGVIGHREPVILLGGSVSDWLVLVVGVLLAGLCAAAFAV
jgi:hypothetical protein